jgi:hypothetical protein
LNVRTRCCFKERFPFSAQLHVHIPVGRPAEIAFGMMLSCVETTPEPVMDLAKEEPAR